MNTMDEILSYHNRVDVIEEIESHYGIIVADSTFTHRGGWNYDVEVLTARTEKRFTVHMDKMPGLGWVVIGS